MRAKQRRGKVAQVHDLEASGHVAVRGVELARGARRTMSTRQRYTSRFDLLEAAPERAAGDRLAHL